ncbi:WD40 repeat domain-containing serine/threonine protein kinase [Nonomuraea sp. NPDC050790]|uniref:WD40 repeat domain-containing serine/threonine protein kinase n=1 Tax=Nonomuraea sp. NPDC050790 TaxID=3364371 RepID=UPI00379F5396
MGKLIDGDPRRLGAYWLAGRLGAGGQGVVYEGYGEDGRRVAVKVLHGDQTAQLAREVRAARRVASFCIAEVVEADLEGPRPYIVSEYVEGPSLRAAGRRFAGGELVRLATAVATALTAIHDAGVVHRDLKPDNVLLGPDGPRLIDFGIARTAEMSLTTTGLVTGTPAYMAPEVFTGQRAGAAADVFAWAGVLVFAATGSDPYEAGNLGATMHRVLSSTPDLSVLPGSLRPLAEAALAKDPADRPSARELLLALVSGDTRLDAARLSRVGGDDSGDGDGDIGRLLAAGGRAAARIGSEAHDPALGALAEETYALLDPAGRELAPEVFLRLVTVGARGELTVRQAALAEILDGRPPPEAAAARRLLEVFGYLLTTSEGEVSLARPALPHAWPRYRRWIEANRDGLAVHREIQAAASRWEAAGRRDGDLFQGSSLEGALRWAATARRNITLSTAERDFLQAAARLSRERARRSRLAALSLAGLLVIALVAGGLAVYQGRLADRRAEQIAGQLRRSEADRLATLAASTRGTDPVLAALFSVAAWRLDRTPRTRAELTVSANQRESGMFRDPATGPDTMRAISANGRLLVSVGDGEARLWDLRTGRRAGGVRALGLGDEPVGAVALSPSGRTLVVATARRALAWAADSGRPLGTLEFAKPFDLVDEWVGVVFPAEDAPVVVGPDLGVRWDLRTGASGPSRVRDGMVFSQDGRWLAEEVGSPDPERVRLTGRGRVEELGDLDGAGTQGVWNKGAPVFAGDGRLVATMAEDSIQFWRMSDTQLLASVPVRGQAEDATRPAGGFDGTTFRYLRADQVFSLDVADLRGGRAGPLEVGQLAPGGVRMATGGLDDGVRIRRVADGRPEGPALELETAHFSPDGRLMVSTDEDRRLVTVVEDGAVHTFTPDQRLGPARVSVSPDGALLALSLTGQREHRVQVWDWRARRMLWQSSHDDGQLTVFSPDGRRLAVGGRQVSVVDAATGRPAGPAFGGSGTDGAVAGLHFDRAGGTLFVIDTRERMTGWDLTAFRRTGAVAGGVGEISARSPREDVVAAWNAADGRIRLYEPVSGTTLATLRDTGGSMDPQVREVLSLAFSADGATLLALGRDGRLNRHPVAPAGVAAAVCARAGRSLSEAEWRANVSPELPYTKICS